MEIVSLKLENFLSFKSLEHTFIKNPVLIQGKNLTEIESKETNGAGKSTMMAGIAYAILATPLRKQTLDRDLITWGEEEAHIWLDIYCPVRKETLNIHRVLKVKGSAVLELTINEEVNSVQYATVNDGNAFILKWIGISAEDLKNYYIINKENFKSFVSSSNTDKLSLINRFIKAEQLDESDALIKEKVKPLENKKSIALGKLHTIEGELNVYNHQLKEEQERNLEDEKLRLIERLNDEIDTTINRYDRAEEKIQQSLSTIKLAEKDIKENQIKISEATKQLLLLEEIDYKDQYDAISVERESTDKKVEEIRKKRKNHLAASIQLEAETNKLAAILKGAVKCPHCGTEFVITDSSVDINKTRAEIARKRDEAHEHDASSKVALQEIADFEKQLKKFEERISGVRAKEQETIKAVRKVQSEITRIKGEIASKNQLITTCKEYIDHNRGVQAECDERSVQLAEQLERAEQEEIQTREEELTGLVTLTQKKLEKARKECEEYEKQISDMMQWGLRFKEFKMSLACEQLKIIQDFANSALQKQRSELRLCIEGFKRDSKGKIKAEITVFVINGEGEYKSFWSFSGGERARVEVALIQAMQEMINGTNEWGGLHFLNIDEVLEGTDPLGLSLLLESLDGCGYPIYIISHVMNIRAGVTTLTVVKENGYSYIE